MIITSRPSEGPNPLEVDLAVSKLDTRTFTVGHRQVAAAMLEELFRGISGRRVIRPGRSDQLPMVVVPARHLARVPPAKRMWRAMQSMTRGRRCRRSNMARAWQSFSCGPVVVQSIDNRAGWRGEGLLYGWWRGRRPLRQALGPLTAWHSSARTGTWAGGSE